MASWSECDTLTNNERFTCETCMYAEFACKPTAGKPATQCGACHRFPLTGDDGFPAITADLFCYEYRCSPVGGEYNGKNVRSRFVSGDDRFALR